MSKRILIIDDSDDIRMGLRDQLRRIGFEVMEENNGRSGLSRIVLLQSKGIPLHGILLDLQMPLLDGLSVLRELHERGSEIPVIVMSALEEKHCLDECLALGARDFLGKPFDRAEVQEVCIRHFGIGSLGAQKEKKF
jgi:two-component system, NtrC family, response regulator AtoC